MLAQFPGALQLARQVINFTQHVLGIKFLKGCYIIQVHISSFKV
jgi:hypothetical protein